MQVTFIVRLLTADHALLAWARVPAEARPQATRASCPFFATGPSWFDIEQDGEVACLTVHWPDLDIARIATLQPTPVQAGQRFLLSWLEPVWLTAGMQNVPLPAVTEREPVRIGVPTGGLGIH